LSREEVIMPDNNTDTLEMSPDDFSSRDNSPYSGNFDLTGFDGTGFGTYTGNDNPGFENDGK
jgi:hypothetical protein